MKNTAEKRARKNIGAFAGAQEAKTTFHTVHIARYDFLCAGKNSVCAKKTCVRACAGASGALLGTWTEGRFIPLCRAVGGEVCCCARIGRMQQLFFKCASRIKNFRSAQARCVDAR